MNRLSVDSVGQSQRCIAIALYPSRKSQILVTTFTKSGKIGELVTEFYSGQERQTHTQRQTHTDGSKS